MINVSQLLLPLGDYWYVASPYSKYPAGHGEAFAMASRLTGILMSHGIRCFSPIAHSHPIDRWSGYRPRDPHRYWLDHDFPFMNHAYGCLVLKMEGWKESAGISEELEFFARENRSIEFLDQQEIEDAYRNGG